MHGVECLAEPCPQGPYRVLGQWPVAGHGVGERGPGDVSGRHPGHGGFGVGVQDRGRPPRPEAPGGFHLAPEPRAELLVQGEVGVHDLDRDGASARAAAQVDPAHTMRRRVCRAAGRRRWCAVRRLPAAAYGLPLWAPGLGRQPRPPGSHGHGDPFCRYRPYGHEAGISPHGKARIRRSSIPFGFTGEKPEGVPGDIRYSPGCPSRGVQGCTERGSERGPVTELRHSSPFQGTECRSHASGVKRGAEKQSPGWCRIHLSSRVHSRPLAPGHRGTGARRPGHRRMVSRRAVPPSRRPGTRSWARSAGRTHARPPAGRGRSGSPAW